jgi:hypothetical protein
MVSALGALDDGQTVPVARLFLACSYQFHGSVRQMSMKRLSRDEARRIAVKFCSVKAGVD